jgi:Heparinase II/III-like protein
MRGSRRFLGWILAVAALAQCALGSPPGDRVADPFLSFDLPDDWEAKFWNTPGIQALLDLEPKALAARVPEQVGLRHCRCPNCNAPESSDPLRWTPEKPDVLTCAVCEVVVPNDKIPAKVDGKIPEESIEVRPRVFHKYPYHAVEPAKQFYADERLYLAAKRDYEAREFLTKLTLYAAVRYREQRADRKDVKLARLAAVLLTRFAQVYPSYATHFDQPGQPKYFQPANLGPPYRRDYQSGKWDWSGCVDVPMNLTIAYAIMRHDPALQSAGRILGDLHPNQTIEHDLFRASAEFVQLQPEEYSEASLMGYRGILAVGRLLNDPELVRDAERRLSEFLRRGFYHDGLWRLGDLRAQRRILDQMDGWFGRLLPREDSSIANGSLILARHAEATVLSAPRSLEVMRAAWPVQASRPMERGASLLGGSGIVRLSVGRASDALDLELRGLGDLGGLAHTDRLSFRMSAAGQSVLADLDDDAPCPDGWDRSSASHNLVVVDGLNQRESSEKLNIPAPGSDILFFAADPDFQVATLEDRHAYPKATARYRHTLIVSASSRSRYAVSVFEVSGGLEHDQIFHAAAGRFGRWRTTVPMTTGPKTLLPHSINYLPNARAEDERWFVQALGAFGELSQGRIERAGQAWLTDGGPGVRLHLLTNYPSPAAIVTGTTTDPTVSTRDAKRAALIVRRRSLDGSSLNTTFITVLEPTGTAAAPLIKVGRVASGPETVVLLVETSDGPEHVVVNLTPGVARSVTLADDSSLTTDGLTARLSRSALVVAGGTFAEAAGRRAGQTRATGVIKSSGRGGPAGARGWFESEFVVPEVETLAGRALLVRHGDGTFRGWTIAAAENLPAGGTRIHVREEPGFTIDPKSREAHYYQFPMSNAPGPHVFRVCKIARG